MKFIKRFYIRNNHIKVNVIIFFLFVIVLCNMFKVCPLLHQITASDPFDSVFCEGSIDLITETSQRQVAEINRVNLIVLFVR